DQRVFFIPDAQLLVTIPDTYDRLIVRRFDVIQELEKSGIDYLLVTSQPVTQCKIGTTYLYQLAVKSKKGGVKLKLESGPAGMKLSPEGQLTWAVPNNLPEKQVDVLLTVSDASGQECFHNFKLQLVEAETAVAANPGPQPTDDPKMKVPEKPVPEPPKE